MAQGLIGAANILVGMSQIMMRSGIVWRNRQRSLVERDGIQIPSLTVSGPWAFIGKASQNPKTWVERASHQSVIDGFPVGNEFVEVLLVFEEIHEASTDLHAAPFGLGYVAGERLRFLQCGSRCGHVLQLHVNIA